ncbi:MAG: sugar phosphate nucleotidyltransferase, partial [Patescibacteria group bacterium]
NKTPKQFLKLFNSQTLTQITASRFSEILPWEKIFCVTVSEEYKKEILKEVPSFISKNIIVEPARRETGPAHGIGALHIYKKDPDAVIITEAADRLVNPVKSYLKCLNAAAKVAYEKSMLISIGVEPRYPHTGLGHIKRGQKYGIFEHRAFYAMDKFVEKPPLKLAIKYTNSGNYYWNAGQFVWRADSILNALKEFEPNISENLDKIFPVIDTNAEEAVTEKAYKAMPKISIDYAVAERAKNMLVLPGDFFWTDIGDWKEVWSNLKQDERGNVIISGDGKPNIVALETSDSIIHTNGRLIALVGIENLVVIDTKDILLICSKSKAQKVKEVVNILKEEKREKYL